MQIYVSELAQQSTEAGMIISVVKTTEMLIGAAVLNSPHPMVMVSDAPLDIVVTFKLLGVNISSDLKWNTHVEAISANDASRLYFLKQLKRAGAGISDLLNIYCTVIRPVLEYASSVWHSSLTVAVTKVLEYLQNRAMNIIILFVLHYLAICVY